MGLIPSERASKLIRIRLRKRSFDGLGPERSWVKGGPGELGGGWGLGQSGGPLSPGGECFAPCRGRLGLASLTGIPLRA